MSDSLFRLTKIMQAGSLSPEQVRAKENMNSIEDNDRIFDPKTILNNKPSLKLTIGA